MTSLIKKPYEIEKLRASGRVVAIIHEEIKKIIRPGITLLELNDLAEKIIAQNNGKSLFKGYQGFPKVICTSVNDVLVHGIPTMYKLKDGDVISVDVGIIIDEYCADAAFTMGVGDISKKAKKIMDASKHALEMGIREVKEGNTVGDIGHAIFKAIRKSGYYTALEYGGHGIGRELHEDPYVFNYGKKGEGEILQSGMVICIEPMLLEKSPQIIVDPHDQWSVKSKKGGLTAHDEHMVLVTKTEGIILSKL